MPMIDCLKDEHKNGHRSKPSNLEDFRIVATGDPSVLDADNLKLFGLFVPCRY